MDGMTLPDAMEGAASTGWLGGLEGPNLEDGGMVESPGVSGAPVLQILSSGGHIGIAAILLTHSLNIT